MNKMPEVAKLLGVEIGEEFGIKGFEETFRMSFGGLVDVTNNSDALINLFNEILMGHHKVIKKPWIPKDGESYFAISHVDGDIEEITCSYNSNNCAYMVDIKIGNCFKTEKQAEQALPKFKEWLNNGEQIADWRD